MKILSFILFLLLFTPQLFSFELLQPQPSAFSLESYSNFELGKVQQQIQDESLGKILLTNSKTQWMTELLQDYLKKSKRIELCIPNALDSCTKSEATLEVLIQNLDVRLERYDGSVLGYIFADSSSNDKYVNAVVNAEIQISLFDKKMHSLLFRKSYLKKDENYDLGARGYGENNSGTGAYYAMDEIVKEFVKELTPHNRVIKIKLKNFPKSLKSGVALLEDLRASEAKIFFKEHADNDDENIKRYSYYGLGLALEQQRDFKSAASSYTQALQFCKRQCTEIEEAFERSQNASQKWELFQKQVNSKK